ncbi:MAG: nitrogen fixation protein FixH [Methylotenera sp.]|nr:nitrogen fixation protein FixH [Methylotenera sp.]
MMSPQEIELEGKPWWYFGHMWLVVGGPLVVVIASFITLYFAIKVPDPVIDTDYYRKGLEINKTLDAKRDGMVPAMLGRNHAATGIKPIDNTNSKN